MERREAPGLLARARAPRDPHFPPKTWVPEAWRVAGSRKPGRGGLANLLGASRRSIPFLLEGEGKQGDGRSRASEKQNPGTAEHWLKCVHILSTSFRGGAKRRTRNAVQEAVSIR